MRYVVGGQCTGCAHCTQTQWVLMVQTAFACHSLGYGDAGCLDELY